MKALVTILVTFFAVNSYATEGLLMLCTAGPITTEHGLKTYEIYVYSDPQNGGFRRLVVYSNQEAKRTKISEIAIFRRNLGRKSAALADVNTRENVIAFRERSAPTREGAIQIRDGKEVFNLDVLCHLDI